MGLDWAPQLEPEPLAFPVKPREGEAFDSWLDRLTSQHEVTRAQLFEHLQCNPKLAKRDLGRGWRALWGTPEMGDFGQLVASLADAIEVPCQRIEATFVPASQNALLPPAIRKFACPACWRRSWIMAEPLTIRREWILRASWQCTEHRLPLAPLGDPMAHRTYWAGWQWLEEQVTAAERLRRRFYVPRSLQQHNENLLAHLLGKPKRGLRRGEFGYQGRFEDNLFHLSRARVALLLAAHSDRDHLAERFERFVAMSVTNLRKAGRGALDPTIRHAKMKGAHAPAKLEVIKRSVWSSSLDAMLQAYGSVVVRADAARARG